MKRFQSLYLVLSAVILIFSSCVKDMDVTPIDPNVATSNNVFKDNAAYKQALAKLYASYAISGQTGGGGGDADIAGIDEGFGNYLRVFWNLQELSSDEAIMAWDDATIKNFHWHTWAPNDVFIAALYSRIFYSISISNEFIRVSQEKIGSADATFAADLKKFNAEARFLRAFSYYHAIDMFGNVPHVTEADLPGAFSPRRIERKDLFKYLETELKQISGDDAAFANQLADPKTNEYGRVDKAAAWMLLAKLYLNAEVYTGEKKYTEALTYIKKVIASGYTIDPKYNRIFCADNNQSPEIIFPICFDGNNTQQYGGMTFILHASNGGGMPLNGIDGGWGGIRTIKQLPTLFGLNEASFANNKRAQSADKRGMFFFDKETWKWEITNVGAFTNGIGVTKFKNVDSNGALLPGSHATFANTDFPMFRLSDAYLMYAEAVLRGGTGGDRATALGYIKALRNRAYNGAAPQFEDADLTLDFILNERARELYWEGQRRTDLVRFGKLTGGSYLWAWKGNAKEGVATSAHRDLYPIPSNDLMANPNLKQNTGY